MGFSTFLRSFFAAVLVVSFSFKGMGVARVSNGSGPWNTPGTWLPVGMPTNADDITIASGHSVTMDGNAGSCLSLTIDGTANWVTAGRTTNVGVGGLTINNGGSITGTATGILNVAGNFTSNAGGTTIGRVTLNVSGTSAINGTITFNSNTGTKTFIGAVTLNAGAVWVSTTISTTSLMVFQNGITNNGTSFSAGGSTFNTNPQSLDGTTAYTFSQIVTITGITLTNNCDVTMTRASAATLAGTGGWTQGANSVLSYMGTTITVTTRDFGTNNNIVDYSNTGTQTVIGTTYRYLIISGSGTKTLGGNTDITDDLTVTAGSLALSTRNFTVNGTTSISGTLSDGSNTGSNLFVGAVTVNAGGIWNCNSVTSVGNTIFQNGITSDGTAFNGGAATFNTNSQILTGTFRLAFRAIVATGVTLTNNFIVTITNTGSGSLSGTGGWIQGNNSTLNYAGSTIAVTTYDFSSDINTVNYNRSGTQTVLGTTYHNLNIAGSGTKTLGAATVVNNDLTITAGTLSLSAFDFTVTGITDVSGRLSDATNAGVNIFIGAITVNASGSWSTNSVTVGTNLTFRGGITHNGTSFSGGACTFDTNDQGIDGSSPLTFRSISITTINLTNFTTVSTTATTAGSLGGTGTWTQGMNSILNYAGSTLTIASWDFTTNPNTVNYNRSGVQTVRAITYYNLGIAGSGIKTLGGTVLVSNNLTVTAGTLSLSTFDITVSGTSSITGTLSDGNNAGIDTFVGLVTINVGGVWLSTSVTTPANLIFQGGITSNGTSFNAAVATFNTNDQSISGTRILTFTGTSVVVTGFVVTNSGTVAMTNTGAGVLNGTGTWTQGTNGTLRYAGTTITVTTVDFSTNAPNTVDYNRAGIQTVRATTYDNLNLSTSGAKSQSAAGNVIINNAFDIDAGVTYDVINDASLYTEMRGTITGTGTITGYANANLLTAGSGDLGTIYFTLGSRFLRDFSTDMIAGSVTLGTDVTVNGTLLMTDGELIINGNTLTIANDVVTTLGTITGSSTSNIIVNGGTATADPNINFTQTSSVTRSLNDLTIDRTGANTNVNLGSALDMIGTVTLSNGTLVTGGNLTLKCSAAACARVAQITGTGAISGNATAERFTAGPFTGWGLLGSPISAGLTMSAWDDDIAMSCSNCPDGTAGGFTSIYTYNEAAVGSYSAAAAYDAINYADPILNGVGYFAYYGTGAVNTSDITLDVTGALRTGPIDLAPTCNSTTSVADDGWNLVANPYPSPISWTALEAAAGDANAIDGTYYSYDTDQGGYINFNAVTQLGTGGLTDAIPMAQGFFVHLTGATSLQADESHKLGGNPTFRKNGNPLPSTQATQYFKLKLSRPGKYTDEAILSFYPNASDSFDYQYDAYKLFGSVTNPHYIALKGQGKLYSVNNVAPLTQSMVIPVFVKTSVNATYTISQQNIASVPYACITLFDSIKNITTDLRTSSYTFTISPGTYHNRFKLNVSFDPPVAFNSVVSPQSCAGSNDGVLIASATGGSGPWDYVWRDSLTSNIVQQHYSQSTPDTLKNLGTGTYILELKTSGACDLASQVFHINSTPPTLVPLSISSTNSPTCFDHNDGFLVAQPTGAGPWNYIWKDSVSGSIIQTHLSVSTSDTLKNLNAGTYIVETRSIGDCDSSVFTFNISSPSIGMVGLSSSSVNNPTCYDETDGYIVARPLGTGPWNYYWADSSSGTIVQTHLGISGYDTLNGLNTGTYIVYIRNTANCDSTVYTFSPIVPPLLAFAAFTTNGDTAYLSQGGTINFNNTSTNATTYGWNFGDASGSTSASPSHAYSSTGTYTVTLNAYNAACDDSSSTTYVVYVLTSPSGIVQSNLGNSVFVGQDKNGVFVRFNDHNGANVIISINNILGQKVIDDTYTKINGQVVYLNVENITNNILFITITSDDNRVTKTISSH